MIEDWHLLTAFAQQHPLFAFVSAVMVFNSEPVRYALAAIAAAVLFAVAAVFTGIVAIKERGHRRDP